MMAASSGLRRIAITLLWLSLLGSGRISPAPLPGRGGDDAAVEEAADVIASSECLDCHGDADLTMTGPDGQEVSIFVDAEKFDASVHGGLLDCVDCHGDLTREHPDNEVRAKPVDCSSCHEDAAEQYATSIHGVSQKMGASAAAKCSDCHGHHDILPVKDPNSPVFKLNLPATCAKCHSNEKLVAEYQIGGNEPTHYLDSIHGQALLKMGLIVAPSCNDCHGVHDIKRSVDRESPINHLNIAKTCGTCHVKIEEVYEKSVHGRLNLGKDNRAPVCTDCHTAHEIETPVNGHFKAVSDQRCGKCHEESLLHYRDTYHGKAMALGRADEAPEVAACYDCHGHHDVLPPSDPESRLSDKNILATCSQCHPDANAGFVKYQPHANPLDHDRYPVLNVTFLLMTGLLIGVFAFFGGHTLLWLGRAIYLYRHDSKTFREAKVQTQRDDEWFTRFQPFDRFLHFLVVTSFLLLVITGMPLKFYYTDWARTLFSVMGGAQVARWLHHFGAIITFLYFLLHTVALAKNAWRNRREMRDPKTGRISVARIKNALFGPDSMVPTMQDWRDFVAHNKWFFGKGPKPQFDRWTYWEKFDYFAVFWGVFAIGLSGLVMWFPEFFTRFLPGWVINVALIVHSDEALLAAGFIFTIHFFNTHFRLEKFPMDTVIFSGRISKAEMLHERKRWYDRLVSTGRLDSFRVQDEWERWKSIARSFGYMFFGIGVILLVLIVYAMASRLSH
ncbi:MAG: cytochrome c3 family protein [Verrucomicrobiales bacterium]|nr:cytochrome c3 family protein [Verrucomicrobiales bacterium]